jgi:hypothetical protein
MQVARASRSLAMTTALLVAWPVVARAQTAPSVAPPAPLAPEAAHAEADTVYLRDGRVLSGTIVAVVPDVEVRVRLSTGDVVTVPRSNIANFIRGQEAEPPQPPPPAEPVQEPPSTKRNRVATGITLLIVGPLVAGVAVFSVNLGALAGEGKPTESTGKALIEEVSAGVAIASVAVGLYLIVANADAGPTHPVSYATPSRSLFEMEASPPAAAMRPASVTFPIVTARF